MGLGYLRLLLAQPQREFSALELSTAANTATRRDDLADDLNVSDDQLGSSSDQQALRDYANRLRALDDEEAQAERDNDLGWLERIRHERSMLLDEVQAASGYWGKPQQRDNPERARDAVRKAIDRAIVAVREVSQPLGDHLDESVKRGTWCRYAPISPMSWHFQTD